MSVARALFLAHASAAWNRARRDAGAPGGVAVAGLALVVALVLLLPAFTVYRLGREVGASWAVASDGADAARWAAIQAIFTLLFPLCGAARYRPALEPRQLGALPVPAASLLAAELPTVLLEVFPLLGATAILASNLGLAAGSRALAPLAALLALQGTAALLATTALLGGGWRIAGAKGLRAALGIASAGGLAAVAAIAGRDGLRSLGRTIVAVLPGSWLVQANSLAERSPRAAAAWTLAALAATTALFALAAAVRLRLADAESPRPVARLKSVALEASRRPTGVLAGAFLAQVLDSRVGRALLWLPTLITLSAAVVLRAAVWDAGELEALPSVWSSRLHAAEVVPIYALVAFVAVIADGVLWLNPFGWYRRGVRSLLVLPATARHQLLGTTLGLAVFATAQTLLAWLPLLAIRPPAATELLLALGAGAFALATLGGIGQAIGLQLPRAVAREGSAESPLHLAWIPTLLILATTGLALLVYRVASVGADWLPPFALALLGGSALLAYRIVLPVLEQELDRKQERLLSI